MEVTKYGIFQTLFLAMMIFFLENMIKIIKSPMQHLLVQQGILILNLKLKKKLKIY